MEVVRKNFNETLPLISASIDKADFLVIDAEFTGLMNGRDVSVFDTPEEYYLCLLKGCTDFMLIQFGLCAFYWDEKKNHYMNDAYNFYLFPRGRPGPEKMFLCQSSSLDFLAAQGFDFNKMIKEGISYMTEPIEAKLRENLTERQKSYSKEKDAINIPEENKQQIDDICMEVRKFIDEKDSDQMEIDRCNSFIRLLLFQEIKARFKDEVLVDTKILENKNRVLRVTRIKSDTDMVDLDTLRKKREWDEFEDAVGFSKVARMISQSEKLVIGHNMLLDVIHTLNHFFQPLPADYKSFKEFAHCMFPRLLDTKYMSSLPPFKDKVTSNVLRDLYTSLSQSPFSVPKVESETGRGYNPSVVKEHEAGYDAYVTGLCFLGMHAHVSRMRGEQAARVHSPTSATLKPFLNKLFLSKTAYQDSPYMNLAGAEPTPTRDHVFHLTFPEEWQRNDINQLFSPFGPITVQFLDDTSALVALCRREQAADMYRALARHKHAKLIPYNKFKALVNNSTTKITTHQSEPLELHKEELNKAELKARQVSRNLVLSRSPQRQKLPEKVSRPRANSATASPAPAQPQTTRKRTSSGVFQVDESEPQPKLVESIRSLSEGSRKKTEIVPNGYQTAESKSKEEKVKKLNVIQKFDSEAKSTCVTAFKESESWD